VSPPGSFDIPNLAALREELGDEFAKELVAAFAGVDSASSVEQKLNEIIDRHLREQEEAFGDDDDPVA
jgi:NTP pyrophosphatase (non-canonical NTP hydrolase)